MTGTHYPEAIKIKNAVSDRNPTIYFTGRIFLLGNFPLEIRVDYSKVMLRRVINQQVEGTGCTTSLTNHKKHAKIGKYCRRQKLSQKITRSVVERWIVQVAPEGSNVENIIWCIETLHYNLRAKSGTDLWILSVCAFPIVLSINVYVKIFKIVGTNMTKGRINWGLPVFWYRNVRVSAKTKVC